ncbi:hypothetical protein [Oryzihumus leptocrescens]|uniref:hypothetical protein n=1 Tax=Oryzihumus leptocrescens TaxID=297536 RepID=UPI00114D900B|nr:hypothetical protein [Oryzihumus leptocrescens]
MHVEKGARVEGVFGWTVAASRVEDLAEVLAATYPGRDVATASLTAFADLASTVSVSVSTDGALLVRAPYDHHVIHELRAREGRWDSALKVWRVPAREANTVAGILRRRFGTREAEVASAEAAWETARDLIGQALDAGRDLPASVSLRGDVDAGNVVIRAPFRTDLPAAMKARGGRWDVTREAWIVPAGSAIDAIAAIRAALGTSDAPLPDPATDGGFPALPWGTRRRNAKDGACDTCGGSVSAGHGVLSRCHGEGHYTYSAWHGGALGGFCDQDRWHVTCRGCVWRRAYGILEGEGFEAWVSLGIPAARVRAYVCAGVTPAEVPGFEQRRASGEDVDGALRAVAALRSAPSAA